MRKRRLVENIDTPLVRQDTISRDQVVYVYETETVIVTKRLGGPNSQEKMLYLRTIKLD